jgi:hypothetical protein
VENDTLHREKHPRALLVSSALALSEVVGSALYFDGSDGVLSHDDQVVFQRDSRPQYLPNLLGYLLRGPWHEPQQD